jgi:predicted nuclease of restriction endonuclease-like RecB superfamily
MENPKHGNPEGGFKMTLSDKHEQEIAAYETDTFENLTVQDALTIIAVFTAQIDPDHCEEDVSRIGAIAENHPEFIETKEKILKRINKFVNSMTAAGNKLKAVDIATEVLMPKLRKTAFELAVEVALPNKVLTPEKKAVLETLATRLSIDSEFAQKTIAKFTE